MTQAQLAWYRAMEERGELVQIADRSALDRHLASLAGRRRTRTTGRSATCSASRARTRSSRSAHLERAYASGPAGRRARALRPRRLRAGHQRLRRSGAARPRAASRNGAARHHPRRHPPLRREPPRRARSLQRSALGEPLQLPRARRAQPAVLGRTDPRADSARRGDRRGVRRLDARARTGCAARRRRRAPASRSRPWSITSITSARSPATRGTPGSGPISTARSDANSAPPTSRTIADLSSLPGAAQGTRLHR